MSLTPYDPKANVLVLGGWTVVAYSDDDFIEIEADDDAMTATAGAGGAVCLTVNNNPLGVLKLRVLQNSQDNSILAAYLAANTIFDMMLTETNAPGSEQVRAQSERAFVKKSAPLKRGKEAQAVEWEVVLLDLKQFNGGLDDGTV